MNTQHSAGFVTRLALCALVLSCLVAVGCVRRNTPAQDPDPVGIDNVLPQVNSFANDINDIPIPAELKWQRDDSMAITTESFRGGVLIYTGSASVQSLRDYMVAAMRDNQWRLVGETTAKNTMLAFVKPNKTCMMTIDENWLKRTKMRLYVAIDNAAGGNMNPFGEIIPQ